MARRLRIAGYVVQPRVVWDDDDTGELSPFEGQVNATEIAPSKLSNFHEDFEARLPEVESQVAAQLAGGGQLTAVPDESDERPTPNRAARRKTARRA